MIDDKLKEWATPVQATYIDAVNEAKSWRGAARTLKVNRRVLERGIKSVKKKAAAHGYAPECGLKAEIPAPFIARGHSSLHKMEEYNPETGWTQVLQWTKTRLDDTQWLEAVQEAIGAFCEGVPKIKPEGAIPHNRRDDVIPWINIGDAHFGMLALANETGHNYNLEIAEAEMKGAMGIVIDEMYPCERIVIQDMGDFTHYDNTSRVTERSRNPLDCSMSYPDMIRVYSRTMRWIVEKALTKAKHVDVIINQANHSRSNDWWMRELLEVAYGHTGRVHVLNNDSPFIAYRMGKTLVMSHHSDLVKPNQLHHVMTTDFRRDYGETDFHYVDIGHIHHAMQLKEHPSVRIESFNQLARPDKHAFQHGYRSRNSLTVVYRSKLFGELSRRVLSLEELQTRMFGGVVAAQREVFRVG